MRPCAAASFVQTTHFASALALQVWIWATACVYLVWRWQWRRGRRLATEAQQREADLEAEQREEFERFAARYRRGPVGDASGPVGAHAQAAAGGAGRGPG